MNKSKISAILNKDSIVLDALSFGITNIALADFTDDQEKEVIEKVIALDKAVGNLSRFLAMKKNREDLSGDDLKSEEKYEKETYSELDE